MHGNKENSINGQSPNLDIEIWDVVQKSLSPLDGVRYAILPLSPGLRFLDIKVRWGKSGEGQQSWLVPPMTICY